MTQKITLSLECHMDDVRHILSLYAILDAARFNHDLQIAGFDIGYTLHYLSDTMEEFLENPGYRVEFLEQDSGRIIEDWLRRRKKVKSDDA